MDSSSEQFIVNALQMLRDFSPNGDSPAADAGNGETELKKEMLCRIGALVSSSREANNKIGRLEKELAAYREANTDTNRMLEKKIEEISLLRLITDTTSRAILTEDPFRQILDQVTEIVGAESGSIMLYSTGNGCLEIKTTSSERSCDEYCALQQTLSGLAVHVTTSGKPYFISDTSEDPHLSSLSEGAARIGSLALFPLVVEGKTVGVLNLRSPYRNVFGDDTERIMHILAGHIAVAVQNALLYGEVRKTKEYLENLVEWAGDAIFTLDPDHRIVSWNTGAQIIFGRDKERALGISIYDLTAKDSVPKLRKKIEEVLELESIVTVETAALRDDGTETQIALTLSPIHSADGQVAGVSGIAKDITERKRIEAELRGLDEAKTYFVSTVSHELRTPLTSIKGLTEVLLHDEMRALSEETIQRYLTIINDECDRLSGLISSLLDLQKLNAGKLDVKCDRIRFANVVRQTAELFDVVSVQEGVDLETEFLSLDEETEVMGDRERLMQILSNLLSNAMKYAGTGGQVFVRLARDGQDVKLTVTDNGIGIPNGEKEKVFEKFYQVDNPITRLKGGTGLGLAITKELVVLHGGRIWVESDGNNGCTFNVTIPAAC